MGQVEVEGKDPMKIVDLCRGVVLVCVQYLNIDGNKGGPFG